MSSPKQHLFGADALVSVSKIVADHMQRAIKCCPNCEHFQIKAEKCGLNSQRPPAHVIAFGCECFSETDIPF